MHKLVFVNHSSALGGAELCLLDLARRMRASCKVLLFEDGPLAQKLRQEGIEVEVLGANKRLQKIRRDSGLLTDLMRIPTLLRLAWRVAKSAQGARGLYANSQKAFVVSACATLLTRAPLIWHVHDILSDAHFSSFHLRILARLAKWRVKGAVVNSGATDKAFRSLTSGRVSSVVVPNGVEASRFLNISPSVRASLREEWGASAQTTVVGIFGRLSPWKGQLFALEALRQASDLDLRIVVVGAALFGEKLYASKVSEVVQSTEPRGRALMLGHREDIPELMSACDVILHCSLSPEPFGRVVVEGMMAERLVVASNDGGPAEILRDGVTGRLFGSGNENDLLKVLRECLSTPARTREMAQQARADALSLYSMQAAFNRWQGAVAKLLNEKI